MKKLAFIALSLLLLLQSGGMLMIYLVHQVSMRQEISNSKNESGLTYERLMLTLDEYNRARIGDREIRIEGKYYDLKEATIEGNHVTLLCVFDRIEGGLMTWIKDCAATDQLPDGKDFPNRLIKLVTTDYTIPHHHSFWIPSPLSSSYSMDDSAGPQKHYFGIVSPPPEAIA